MQLHLKTTHIHSIYFRQASLTCIAARLLLARSVMKHKHDQKNDRKSLLQERHFTQTYCSAKLTLIRSLSIQTSIHVARTVIKNILLNVRCITHPYIITTTMS